MSAAEKAVGWAVGVAADSSHGYDQTNRWGPDYDCSSLVISAFDHAGIPVKSRGATYTGNMYMAFTACGFRDITKEVNLYTGAGMKAGDVLLHHKNHTALYIGGGQLVQASGNEKGGITGGKTGDQTGGEIHVRGYFNYPWNCVLRYGEETAAGADKATTEEAGIYTVQHGDTLWGLAEAWLGDGTRYGEIMELNDLRTDSLRIGQILKKPVAAAAEPDQSHEIPMPELSMGDTGQAVVIMQSLLYDNGFDIGPDGADGEFGVNTLAGLKEFQSDARLEADGVCGVKTWYALVGVLNGQ